MKSYGLKGIVKLTICDVKLHDQAMVHTVERLERERQAAQTMFGVFPWAKQARWGLVLTLRSHGSSLLSSTWGKLWHGTLLITSRTRYRTMTWIFSETREHPHWFEVVLQTYIPFPITSSPENISGINTLPRPYSIQSYDTAKNRTE